MLFYQWETYDFYKNCLQFFLGVGICPWADMPVIIGIALRKQIRFH